jgi:hypothetical protein
MTQSNFKMGNAAKKIAGVKGNGYAEKNLSFTDGIGLDPLDFPG